MHLEQESVRTIDDLSGQIISRSVMGLGLETDYPVVSGQSQAKKDIA